MYSGKPVRLTVTSLAGWALLACSPLAWPQDVPIPQNQSVADAAREARAGKKNAAKSPKVISDDDIDTRSVKPGAEGLTVSAPPASDSIPPSAAAVSAVEASDAAVAAAEKNPPVTPGEDREIAKVKEQVVEATAVLDLLKRAFALDQDTYYSKPGYTDDHDGKSKLDGEQEQVNDKQQIVDRLKAQLAELEAARNSKKAASGEAAAPPDAEKPAEAPAAAPPQR